MPVRVGDDCLELCVDVDSFEEKDSDLTDPQGVKSIDSYAKNYR